VEIVDGVIWQLSVLYHSPRDHEKRRPRWHIRDAVNLLYTAKKEAVLEEKYEQGKQTHKGASHDTPCARRRASGGIFGINWGGGALVGGWPVSDSSLTFYVLFLCHRQGIFRLVTHGLRAARCLWVV